MKSQASFFIKAIFVVVLLFLFSFTLVQISNFQKTVVEEKEKSDFRSNVLNIAQKLLTDKNCLAHEYEETSRKIIIDKKKLDLFSNSFIDEEPACAKALTFDYNISIWSLEKNFTIYPGLKRVSSGSQTAEDFAQHVCEIGNDMVLFVRCNWNPRELKEKGEDPCLGQSEIDPPWIIPFCPDSCYPDPLEKCPYPKHAPCCFNFHCPKDKCECIKSSKGHPWVVSCSKEETKDFTECTRVGGEHSYCGEIEVEVEIPVGTETPVDIRREIASFGLTMKAGFSTFSPEKAKKEELTINIPVTIKYNETFSIEGYFLMYAVRGELEEFFSLLEYICEKAINNEYIKFSKQFHFSYDIKKIGDKICMLNSCKRFKCPLSLEMDYFKAGTHILSFEANKNLNKIIVK
ncbi:MAG: hypothetical protein QXG91_00970 [Candidatus Aenigmatarchaeota archaeon]